MKTRRWPALGLLLLVCVVAVLIPLLPAAQEERVRLPAGTHVRAGEPTRGEMTAAYRDAVRLVRDKCPFTWPQAQVEKVVARKLLALGIREEEIAPFFGGLNFCERVVVELRGRFSDEQLWRVMLEGALEGLHEPRARMMSAEEYRRIPGCTGFGPGPSGIGAYLYESDEHLLIETMDGLPASRAGVRSGDELVAVDGRPVSTSRDATTLLRGAPGSDVAVTLRRGDRESVVVMRRERLSNCVGVRRVAPDAVLIRVHAMGNDLRGELDLELPRTGIHRIVIDLRHQPGGYLTAAIDLLSAVVPESTLAVDVVASDEIKHYPTSKSRLVTARVAVLIDRWTSGSAEVAAAALRDQAHALLVGEATRGETAIFTLSLLPDQSAIFYPIAVFRSPSGRVIHHNPLIPDVQVQCTDLDRVRTSDPVLQEALRRLSS